MEISQGVGCFQVDAEFIALLGLTLHLIIMTEVNSMGVILVVQYVLGNIFSVDFLAIQFCYQYELFKTDIRSLFYGTAVDVEFSGQRVFSFTQRSSTGKITVIQTRDLLL